ncbi:hypothetical protein Tco_1112911 [Tanacetum coccineum]|uniref:Uncharacterized protein n=1 Tax=Tanacetum coccineum TaxID=301880 RepID=A0ABQ5IQN5_9ASTR
MCLFILDLALPGSIRIVIRFSKGRMITMVEMSIYDFMTLPSWGDANIVKEAHQLPTSILKRVLRNTSAPAAEGTHVHVPTPDEIIVAKPDHLLAKKSKILVKRKAHSSLVVPSEPFQPARRRRFRKKTSEDGVSAPTMEKSEGVDKADMDDFCTELKDSMQRDKGTSVRDVSAPSLRIGKRLGSPPRLLGYYFLQTISCSAATGFSGKGGAEVMRRQLDHLDVLARNALARDEEYNQIPNDDFGTASRSEEIDILFFPLAPSPYVMPYPFEGESLPEYTKEQWDRAHALEDNTLCSEIFKDPDVCRRALDQTITPVELKRIESLLPFELSN